MGDLGGFSYIDACGDCVEDSSSLSDDENDPDGDDVCNAGAGNGDADNCPFTENTDQHNFDGDTYGDACDIDDDNDNSLDEDDSSHDVTFSGRNSQN